ncbi:unnamed protein product [Ixodes pacificus]
MVGPGRAAVVDDVPHNTGRALPLVWCAGGHAARHAAAAHVPRLTSAPHATRCVRRRPDESRAAPVRMRRRGTGRCRRRCPSLMPLRRRLSLAASYGHAPSAQLLRASCTQRSEMALRDRQRRKAARCRALERK